MHRNAGSSEHVEMASGERLPRAWDDMVQTMDSALIAAERNNLILAFEPESENIVNSATRARKLLNELRNPRLRTVIDPANLISPDAIRKKSSMKLLLY